MRVKMNIKERSQNISAKHNTMACFLNLRAGAHEEIGGRATEN